MKVQVLYETIRCSKCRKRATYYMDGIGFCDDHVKGIEEFLRSFVKFIEYRKSN